MNKVNHSIFEVLKYDLKDPIHVHTFDNGTQVITYSDKILRKARIIDSKYSSQCLDTDHDKKSVLNVSGSLIGFYDENYIDSFSLDGRKTSLHVENGIKEVLWHPLGYLDSCLVVLTQQDTIELYELSSPNYQIPTLVLNQHTTQLGLSSHVSDICSIEFSPNGLSLYMFSSADAGDIYVIFPIFPARMKSLKSLWEAQWHTATALYEGINKDTSDETKLAIIEYYEFTSKLYKKLGNDVESEFVELRIPSHRRMVVPQGPFRMHGFPDGLYSYSGTKLVSVPISDDEAHVIAVSFSNNTNLIFFQESQPIMSWTRPMSDVYSLVLMEIHNSQGELHPIENGIAICGESETQIVRIPYLASLGQCFSDVNITALQGLELKTEVSKLPGCYSKAARWNTPGISGFILTGQSIPILVHQETECANPDHADSDLVPSSSYTVCFPSTAEDLNISKRELQRKFQLPLPLVPYELKNLPLNCNQNEQQLAFLTTLSQEVMNRVIMAQSLAYQQHKRASAQQYELCRQLKAASGLLVSSEKLSEQRISLESRLRAVLDKGIVLKQRLSGLQTTLENSSSTDCMHNLPISHAELKWFRELKSQILAFNRYTLNFISTRDSLAFIRTELDSLEIHHAKRDSFDFKKLQKLLALDASIIYKCNYQLITAARDLEQKLYI